MSESKNKANRDSVTAKKELAKRQELIDKYKPRCPGCNEDFTADQNVNQCQVCKYFVCDGCTISHRCKNVKPTPPLRIA